MSVGMATLVFTCLACGEAVPVSKVNVCALDPNLQKKLKCLPGKFSKSLNPNLGGCSFCQSPGKAYTSSILKIEYNILKYTQFSILYLLILNHL
jgi:hypothetical protein